MERICHQESLFMEDLGSTSLFWIWWVPWSFMGNCCEGLMTLRSQQGQWEKTTMLLVMFQLLQMTFFGLAAVNDLQPEKKAESTLSKFKDLFSVFAFPVGTVRTPHLQILHSFKCKKPPKQNTMLHINSAFAAFSLVCCSTFLGNLCIW